jgi:hypothetical protein
VSASQFGGVAPAHSIIAFEVIGADDVARHDDANFALKLGALIESAGIPSVHLPIGDCVLIVGHSELRDGSAKWLPLKVVHALFDSVTRTTAQRGAKHHDSQYSHF